MPTDLLWPTSDTLQALVVILRAAHRAGDHDLEASAAEELRYRFGVEVRFLDEERGDHDS
jgi:hypothetical protein